MALTEIYVDPSIDANTGTGTDVDPYGDLEYAIVQETFDTVNGTRINIKAGTDEVVVAELGDSMDNVSVSIAWAPGLGSPLIFQGYTSTAGDGGIGGISGGGLVAVFSDNAKNYIHFTDLHLHNVGANFIVDCNDYCSATNCELNNGTGSAAWSADTAASVAGCYIHDFAGIYISGTSGSFANNFLKSGTTNKITTGISWSAVASCVRNIISADGSSTGVNIGGHGSFVEHNSIYSDAGTGAGIFVGNKAISSISNNLIEGFSGAGGRGIDADIAGAQVAKFAGNAVFDCETAYAALVLPAIWGLDDNETLSGSPFTAPSTDDFAPVDVGNVKEGSLPQGWSGP